MTELISREVSRAEDRFDNVELSDDEGSTSSKRRKTADDEDDAEISSESRESDGEGENLGSEDTEEDDEDGDGADEESGKGFIVNDSNKRLSRSERAQALGTVSRASTNDEDDDDEENDADEDDDEDDDDEGRKKKRRPPPKRRETKDDEIKASFMPVGVVPNKPLSVLGLSLCAVRVVKESALFRCLLDAYTVDEMPVVSEAAKRYREKNDFFEDQSRVDAPRPLHFCQETRSSNFVSGFPRDKQREIYQKGLEDAQMNSSSPKRCLVYCIVTFRTPEEAREHSCPFLMYPVKGRLVKSSMSTTNWQSATEFPTDGLDKYNAEANAALITEANWACSVLDKRPIESCTARQPIAENALFEIAFEGATEFGAFGAALPIVHNMKFSNGKRAAPHENFVSLDRSMTSKRFTDMIRRTNYLLDLKSDAKPDHQRKIGYYPSRCACICEKSRHACQLLLAKKRSEDLKKTKHKFLRFSVQKGLMILDDVLFLLRKNYVAAVEQQSYTFEFLKCVLLPAVAQPSFWNIVELAGFDNATIMLMEEVDAKFIELYASDCPQMLMIHSSFYTYRLQDNATFVKALASRLRLSAEAVRRYASLSEYLLQQIENVPTDSRFVSRPDVSQEVRRMCWPENEFSPISAIEQQFEGDRKSTFVCTRSLIQEDTLLALSLAYGFQRNVKLLRSDNAESLQTLMYENAVDGSHMLIVVSDEEEETYWKSYQKHFPMLVVYSVRDFNEKRFAVYLTTLKRLEEGEAWNVAFPRVDKIPYLVLSRLLMLLCVKKRADAKIINDWCRSVFIGGEAALAKTEEDFCGGFCRGGRLFVGGLAFQVAEYKNRSGSFAEDMYFSGVLDSRTIETYSVVDQYLSDAMEFERDGEEMVVSANAETERCLTSKRLAFSRTKSNVNRRVALQYLNEFNRITKEDLTMFLATQTPFGTISANMQMKVEANCHEQLPYLKNPTANPNHYAVIFDTVLDDEFLTPIENVSDEHFGMGYNLSKLPALLNEQQTDQILAYHRGWKNNLRSGLSLGGMISLAQAKPRAIFVFGSAEQSIENRVIAQPSPPWFLMPPSKNGEGRRWFQNSEAAELSVLTWLLQRVWRE